MGLFKRKETNQEIGERLFKLTDGKDYGIFPPPMKAQVAVDELCRFFLGEDWYSVNPISAEQINTEIVYEIETRYKKRNPLEIERYKRLWIKSIASNLNASIETRKKNDEQLEALNEGWKIREKELKEELEKYKKIAQVFAKAINNHTIDEDICKQMGKDFDCTLFNHDEKFCEECIIEWAEKEVEND